jgi:hypothetical protein
VNPSLGVLLALALPPARAQDAPLRLDEGPLDNPAFLPLDEAANRALARADVLHATLRDAADGTATARRWSEVFDLWHVALRDSLPGAVCAPLPAESGAAASRAWPDPDGTADAALDRRRDGVEAAVLRRLLSLPAAARADWSLHQAPIADEALGLARSDTGALAQIERRFPATEAAVRAALALADSALESSRPHSAAGWLERARRHLEWRGPSDAEAQAAIAAREPWIRAELAPTDSLAVAGWESATRLEARTFVALDDLRRRGARPRTEPGMFVRPALAFLDADRVLTHFSNGEQSQLLALYDLAQSVQLGRTDLTQYLRDGGVAVGPLLEPLEPPGWPLTVAVHGRKVVLTVGRRGNSRGNALVCIELEDSVDPLGPPQLRTKWLWFDGKPIAGAAAADTGGEPLWQACEFQSGAQVVGDLVVAVVREYDLAEPDGAFNAREGASTQLRTWLAAFDLESGELAWRRWIGRGLEIQRAAGRFFGARSPAASASPLSAHGLRALLTSNTGFSALVDTLDGRVDWSLRTRRRPADGRRWTGAAPAFDRASGAWVLAPADSDHVYWLRDGPDLDGRGLFVAPPRACDSEAVLVGACGGTALVLKPHGAERALSSWHGASGRTSLAAYLGADELFTGDGVACATRALYASQRGVYLIDLERELYLLDFAALERERGLVRGAQPSGGSVFAHGRWVCVLGASTMWVFEAR